MKAKSVITLVLLTASLTAVALTFWYWGRRHPPLHTSRVQEDSTYVPSLITVTLPARRDFTIRTPWVGTVESRASIELTTLTAGRVEAIEAADQAGIEAGRPVMQLGGPLVDGARKRFAVDIASLESQLKLARQTEQRLKQDLKARLATQNQVAAAQDKQIRLEAQLRDSRLSLKNFENQIQLLAPIDGVFTNRTVSVGQDVIAGQVVGEIIDTHRLRITASVFPPQGAQLQGKTATIRSGDQQTLTGLVHSVLPQASTTGAVGIWIEGPHIDAQLRTGQTVGGTLDVMIRSDALAVPSSAIVYDAREQPFVFVRKGKTYAKLKVQLGLTQDGWVEIRSGLPPDQKVVTQGAYELFHRQFNTQFKVQD